MCGGDSVCEALPCLHQGTVRWMVFAGKSGAPAIPSAEEFQQYCVESLYACVCVCVCVCVFMNAGSGPQEAARCLGVGWVKLNCLRT